MKTLIKMQFDPVIAKELDTDCAIIYANIEFWCYKNKANKRNLHDGTYWTYNSIQAFQEQFNYLSEGQIRRCLKKLEEAEYIITGNYNKTPFDQTKWYSVKSIFLNQKIELMKTTNGVDEIDKPIPYNKPNFKPDSFDKEEKPKIDKFQFLQLWNKSRVHFEVVKESNANMFPYQSTNDLKDLSEVYNKEDFRKALSGLMKQKGSFASGFKSNIKHFLQPDHFERYLDAYNNKNFTLYDSEEKQGTKFSL